MENKRIIVCAGPGVKTFTKEEEAELIEAIIKAFEEYQLITFEEAAQLQTLSSSVTHATVPSEKESIITLKQRLKHSKSPMETIQIQREIGKLSKKVGQKGKGNGTQY